MKRNIFLMFFLAIVLLQDILLTVKLVDIFSSLSTVKGSLSSSYLFYLVGTVIFSTVVNIVLLMVFRTNTMLPKRVSKWLYLVLFAYQTAILAALAVVLIIKL